jgi:hypothetical protein
MLLCRARRRLERLLEPFVSQQTRTRGHDDG